MEAQVAVAKVGKYATSESGDTVEVTERPRGGLSLVLADGQRSGKGAKAISNMVARKAISLLAEGVRDGAAARATHDYLRTQRGGKVSSTLNIISVDMDSGTLVLSRNSHCPVVVINPDGITLLDQPSEAIGIYAWTKPVITELPLREDTYVIVFTDGVLNAGRRYGQHLDVPELVRNLLASGVRAATSLADAILQRSVELDQGRPHDDISVVVVAIVAGKDGDDVRRMAISFPLPERWGIG
ncbi:MAG: serine/threonine-protein phosphatase [Anaerolineae bacterium]|jgi:serine phosphatase RsbU (regulator of sigma subunit)|nr:serine/threonine-protein phosphatase [Anaerolineae bacterium]MDH7474630.1 PP2C family protein-serine/threonine phosphatase [Anaerolineae bacterium]